MGTLVEACLDQLDLDLEDVSMVVVNNHHHRVLTMENQQEKMEWEEGLRINGGTEDGYSDDFNIIPNAQKIEISHHLAHAYSTATQCPFDSGLVVVMDGMGETYRTMRAALDGNDTQYFSDLMYEGDFECIPSDIRELSKKSIYDWREGESAYEFTKKDNIMKIKPVFKRFVEERTPPTLFNHGFENMESIGAVYSRASSHIFGNWNTCGKVMGLAPWMGHSWYADEKKGALITAAKTLDPIMKGSIYKEGEDSFQVDSSVMMGIPYTARNDPDLFDKDGIMNEKGKFDFDDVSMENTGKNESIRVPSKVALDAISLSSRIQQDLETVVMDFVSYCKVKTKQENLCLAGGVALNSPLNERLSRELGFRKTFIPPYPGDDGIAVGCCAYGLYGINNVKAETKPKLWSEPLSPYLGPQYSGDEIRNAINAAAPWLDVEFISNDQERFDIMTKEIDSSGVIAWFHGRSELGPRALGHRSILADPRKKGLIRFINDSVKKRESFRPFAPSVMADETVHWFELEENETADISPYMSVTANVRTSKRKLIPAVTSVNGSSRLQTVTKEREPLFYNFLSNFFKKTGIPMVLNTSFNTLPGEPIVETPKDAIRSFLCSNGAIELLVLGNYVIKRKKCDVKRLLGVVGEDGLDIPPACPKRAGPAQFEATFSTGDDNSESITTVTRVKMRDSPMHNEKDGGWLPLVDELEGQLLGVCDGTVGVNDIASQFLGSPPDDDEKTGDKELKERQEFEKNVFANIVERFVRLYEQALISW